VTWFVVGAAVILVLLIVNFVVYVVRRRRLGVGTIRDASKVLITPIGAFTYGAMVLGFLVGFGAPYVAPDSSFGRWLAEPVTLAAFAVWCMFGAFVPQLALHAFGLPSWHRVKPQ